MKPQPKIQAAGAAGAVAILAVWIADLFGAAMPGEVGAAVGTLAALGAGYLMPSGRHAAEEE